MLSSYSANSSANSSTTSFHSFEAVQAPITSRYYRFSDHTRRPYSLQHNEHDTDIWIESGDCLIFLTDSTAISTAYRISISVLRQNNAVYLLDSCSSKRAQSPGSCGSSDSGYESSTSGPCEIHLDMPGGLSEQETIDYHIATRNYVAFLLKKPLVGSSLALALKDVWHRIQQWHTAHTSIDVLLAYCKDQGYLDITGNALHATSMLAFAEAAQSRSLWINAFAHCVAMQEQLTVDSEFSNLSNTTKALTIRAALEMQIHIPQVIKAVGTLLETELNDENLGLSKPAREHLDHFRGYLHSFFIEKLGYFPPTRAEDDFDKDIWREVHDDFQSMYDYLADLEAAGEALGDRGVTGGICVHQNVEAFNQKHSLAPLPHSLPLLPDMTPTRRATESQSGLVRNFKLVRVESDFRPSARQALLSAANSSDIELMERPIVQEYINFESQRLEEKLSVAEARKVRWILIYCTLQMLKSVVMAPVEVVGAENAPYSLCVNVSCCPIWAVESVKQSRAQSVSSLNNSYGLEVVVPAELEADRISIHPDCEAENATDFFSKRRSSVVGKLDDDSEPGQTRTTPPPISRSLSIRTSVSSSMTALQKSVIGSLSRRSSVRMSQLMPRKKPSLQSINTDFDAEYDHFVPATIMESSVLISPVSPITTKTISPFSVVPVLEDSELDMLTPIDYAPVWDGYTSTPTSETSGTDSPESDGETEVTAPSTRGNSYEESKFMGLLTPLEEDQNYSRRPATAFRHYNASTTSLNAGCYMPSGMRGHAAPMSRYAAGQRHHVYATRQDAEYVMGSRWR